jgi:tetratricopeptide (TPR) repeat protein
MPEEGEDLYNQAIASLTAALTVLDKDTSPQKWGVAQRALGQVNANSDTYLAIAGKTSNATRLTQSIKAFNAALEIYTKEADPISWAGLNFQLGDIYTTLHQRQGGIVWLEKSIVSHKKVLEVLKREDNPSVWAQVQYFLGNGLVELGAAGRNKELLRESIVASLLATESDYFKTIFPEFYDQNLRNIGIAEGLIKKYDAEN